MTRVIRILCAVVVMCGYLFVYDAHAACYSGDSCMSSSSCGTNGVCQGGKCYCGTDTPAVEGCVPFYAESVPSGYTAVGNTTMLGCASYSYDCYERYKICVGTCNTCSSGYGSKKDAVGIGPDGACGYIAAGYKYCDSEIAVFCQYGTCPNGTDDECVFEGSTCGDNGCCSEPSVVVDPDPECQSNSDCGTDTAWTASGITGIQSRTTYACALGSCSTATSYRCAPKYYSAGGKSSSSDTSSLSCTECPAYGIRVSQSLMYGSSPTTETCGPGYSNGGAASITDCYIANSFLSDDAIAAATITYTDDLGSYTLPDGFGCYFDTSATNLAANTCGSGQIINPEDPLDPLNPGTITCVSGFACTSDSECGTGMCGKSGCKCPA